MSQWEKLLNRLYALDQSLRYDELKKILISFGYIPEETGGGSSHVTFRKHGSNPVTIPRHKPIKKTYIEIVRDTVDMSIKEKQDNLRTDGGEENE